MFKLFWGTQEDTRSQGRFYKEKNLGETAKLIKTLIKKETELANVIDASEIPPFDLIRKQQVLKRYLSEIDEKIKAYNGNPSLSILSIAAELLLLTTDAIIYHSDELNYFRDGRKQALGKATTISSYLLTFGTAGLLTASTLGLGAITYLGGHYLNKTTRELTQYDEEKTATLLNIIHLLDNLLKVVNYYNGLPTTTVERKLALKALNSIKPRRKLEVDDNPAEIENVISRFTDNFDAFIEFFETKFPKDKYACMYCPITLSLMTDPVLLGTTGHTFQRESIQASLASKPMKNPLSNETIDNVDLSTNYGLKETIIRSIEDIKEEYLAYKAEKSSAPELL